MIFHDLSFLQPSNAFGRPILLSFPETVPAYLGGALAVVKPEEALTLRWRLGYCCSRGCFVVSALAGEALALACLDISSLYDLSERTDNISKCLSVLAASADMSSLSRSGGTQEALCLPSGDW